MKKGRQASCLSPAYLAIVLSIDALRGKQEATSNDTTRCAAAVWVDRVRKRRLKLSKSKSYAAKTLAISRQIARCLEEPRRIRSEHRCQCQGFRRRPFQLSAKLTIPS